MDAEKTGKLIAELRKEKNMTQQQLAEQLYVSDKAVSRWETGRGFPEITVLEDIADLLGVGVAEIIRGERMKDMVSSKETESIAEDSVRMSKEYVRKKRIAHFVLGSLIAAAVLIAAWAHLNSPIYFKDPDRVTQIRELDDGTIVALLEEDVAGYEIEKVKGEAGEDCAFMSCYSTKAYEWFGRKQKKIALLSESGGTDYIYYYPCEGEDRLIYSNGKAPSSGVVTLPRLVYNYWIILAGLFSVIGIIIYALLKNRYLKQIVLKVTPLPLSFLASLLIILAGHFEEIYNAAYYFSGIVLLSIAIYALAMIALIRNRKEKI